MRFIYQDAHGGFRSEQRDGSSAIRPCYAALSHTWGPASQEVSLHDVQMSTGHDKLGMTKLKICNDRAEKYGLKYSWVDTCCIDKSNSAELAEAIISMYEWYRNSSVCFVYLSDVSLASWQTDLPKTRWFTRGWTLQELIAPSRIDFLDKDGQYLGDRTSLEDIIHDATKIPLEVLRGESISTYSVEERFKWAAGRITDRREDAAYSLFGIFDVSMAVLYGEGRDRAFRRLRDEIASAQKKPPVNKAQAFLLRSHEDLEREAFQADLMKLSEPLRLLLVLEREYNHLRYDALGGGILVSLPVFETYHCTHAVVWKESAHRSSIFRLADVLGMLSQPETFALETKVVEEQNINGQQRSSYWASCSREGLLYLLCQHFASFTDNGEGMKTTIGTFTARRGMAGSPVISYFPNDRAPAVHNLTLMFRGSCEQPGLWNETPLYADSKRLRHIDSFSGTQESEQVLFGLRKGYLSFRSHRQRHDLKAARRKCRELVAHYFGSTERYPTGPYSKIETWLQRIESSSDDLPEDISTLEEYDEQLLDLRRHFVLDSRDALTKYITDPLENTSLTSELDRMDKVIASSLKNDDYVDTNDLLPAMIIWLRCSKTFLCSVACAPSWQDIFNSTEKIIHIR